MTQSSTERGNSFRDTVASMLEAAGFIAESEIRVGNKKVDVVWRREDVDGSSRYLVEAKDYSATLNLDECTKFSTQYGKLIANRDAEKAWLISRGEVSPDGRAEIDTNPNLKCMTFAEFQRRLMGIDGYLLGILAAFEAEHIAEWYVRPHTEKDQDLETVVRIWIENDDALPLAIIAEYGKGKSTFAKYLAATLAREALRETSERVPILVSLGDIVDEQSLEGLLGKVLASRQGIRGYNFSLFDKMNQAGRFVVIFDGFDEMKHGMTLPRFEANISELMRLDKGKAKVLILGRDTAFHDDVEFHSIIEGRHFTSGGHYVRVPDRRSFSQIRVRDFTLEEARQFVRSFFPSMWREASRGLGRQNESQQIQERIDEILSGSFNSLLVRPVHAQMLCQIATDHDLSLVGLSKYGLFDRFVHFLIDREVKKRGRSPLFSRVIRRRFNGALALWLWQEGAISTVSLASVPEKLCRDATGDVQHDYDAIALRKELVAGCLVEKSSGAIYFGHRSLQEFLVAEAMIQNNVMTDSHLENADARYQYFSDSINLLNPEIENFIIEAVKTNENLKLSARSWLLLLSGLRRADVPILGMRLFVDLVCESKVDIPEHGIDPWFGWLRYFAINGNPEFRVNSRASADALLSLFIEATELSVDCQAGMLLLASKALMRPYFDRERRQLCT